MHVSTDDQRYMDVGSCQLHDMFKSDAQSITVAVLPSHGLNVLAVGTLGMFTCCSGTAMNRLLVMREFTHSLTHLIQSHS
jgi:hypothetical protein